ncbi:SDR family NAD(P)-dependent oxidoreductase [Lentzea sp. NPDC051838]|uniref:SDR family NAD(P)-dependent oxidoreductase n=1 Tax=Lentzea sp. NPDC051838 TaxID=3154849 RepID=UPI0034197FAD
MHLEGQVAVITGGTRGIGFGIATAFAANGARVVLCGRSEDKGKQALAELGLGDRATFHVCDVRVPDQLDALIDDTVRDFGRVDVLVNNAGGSDGFAPVHQLADEAWQNALDWNINAVFRGTRRVLPHMLAAGYGRIINISSTEGKSGNKAAVSHYITNKHAINGFTKAVAFEYGPQGITCNAICPGAVETDIMREAGPLVAEAEGITYEQFLDIYRGHAKTKQLNTVEEVAAMALLVAGPHSAGINGALLNVDGGTAEW